mgnify:CR=1 FL=1
MPQSFDSRNPPFDRLDAAEIDQLRQALDVGYFAPGQVIIAADQPAQFFHVIIKGLVEERRDGEVDHVLEAKDSFDARALIHGKPGSAFVAAEETLCYLIPKDIVLGLTQNNPAFGAFFYSEISRKLDALAQSREGQGVESVLRARISEARLQPAVFIAADATIKEAAMAMQDSHTNALFVRDGQRVGVVTGMNLAKAVLNKAKAATTPVRDVCHFDVVAVDKDDFIIDALLLMTRHNKRRLAVRDNGELAGMLEDIGILGLFAGNSQLIPGRIDRAKSIADLETTASDIQAQVERLHRQGVKADLIAEITSDLNRRLFAKLFELTAPKSILSKGCLMIMGSEGRGEQTVRTDQDNGLLLAGPVAEEDLTAFRKLFTSALERLGFPPCPGNIMVRNPIWSMPVEDFIRQVKGWVMTPEENTPMYLAILADAIPVGRNPDLLARAKSALFDVLRGEKIHMAHFAKAIDMFAGSGGMLNALMSSVGREDAINLKKAGVFPIVHGIRSYAIEKGIADTGTLTRIEALAAQGALDGDMAKELAGAFRYLMELRLRSQLAAVKHGNPEAEADIKPSTLTTLERDLLRDALRVVKEFRELVRAHYNLRMF